MQSFLLPPCTQVLLWKTPLQRFKEFAHSDTLLTLQLKWSIFSIPLMQGEVIIKRYNCGLKHFYLRCHNLQIWNVDIFDDGCIRIITFFLRTKLDPFNCLWIFIACLQNSKATWPMGLRVSTRASTRTRQVSVCLSLLRSFSQPMPGKPSHASTNLPSSQPSGIATTSTFLFAFPWHV